MRNGGVRILAGRSFQGVLMFALGLAFALLPAPAWGRQNAGMPPSTAASPTDATREELANFDRFLDDHPILERELGSNPSLVNDSNFVKSEPDLKIFLSHHPAVQTQLQKDPQYLATRMNLAEANAANHAAPPNPSLDQSEAGQMREFLRAHDTIDQLLKQNPALINDSTFLGAHLDLKMFLDQHPRARDLFVQNPRYFITPAADSHAPAPDPANPPKPKVARADAPDQPTFNFGVTPEDVGRMDQFLEDNPKIAKDLSRDPLLVANHHYLDHHDELRRFFDEHVRVREAFAEDPRYFVPGNGFGAAQPRLDISTNQKLSSRDLATTDTFLRKHKHIAKTLRANPMVVQDLDYLHHHGDLRKFFDENPHIQTEMDEHPRYFMRREEQFHQSESFAFQKHK